MYNTCPGASKSQVQDDGSSLPLQDLLEHIILLVTLFLCQVWHITTSAGPEPNEHLSVSIFLSLGL